MSLTPLVPATTPRPHISRPPALTNETSSEWWAPDIVRFLNSRYVKYLNYSIFSFLFKAYVFVTYKHPEKFFCLLYWEAICSCWVCPREVLEERDYVILPSSLQDTHEWRFIKQYSYRHFKLKEILFSVKIMNLATTEVINSFLFRVHIDTIDKIIKIIKIIISRISVSCGKQTSWKMTTSGRCRFVF